jgi:hypothetical protein
VIERLHDPRLRQECLNELARRRTRIGEIVAEAVDLPPVVHRIDDELAAKRFDRDLAVLAERQREQHDVALLRRLFGGDRDRAGGEDVRDEGDPRAAAGVRDEHTISGRDGQAGEHGADLADAEDGERLRHARRSIRIPMGSIVDIRASA